MLCDDAKCPRWVICSWHKIEHFAKTFSFFVVQVLNVWCKCCALCDTAHRRWFEEVLGSEVFRNDEWATGLALSGLSLLMYMITHLFLFRFAGSRWQPPAVAGMCGLPQPPTVAFSKDSSTGRVRLDSGGQTEPVERIARVDGLHQLTQHCSFCCSRRRTVKLEQQTPRDDVIHARPQCRDESEVTQKTVNLCSGAVPRSHVLRFD